MQGHNLINVLIQVCVMIHANTVKAGINSSSLQFSGGFGIEML